MYLLNVKRYASVFVLSFLLSIMAISCNENEPADEYAIESTALDAPITYQDSSITKAIRADLAIARGVNDENITLKTEEGIVTLSGDANSLLSKQRAKRIAQSVKGVRSVVNTITVHSDRSDRAVEQDVKAALAGDPATDDWELTASVSNNVVTLEGSVDSWQEKQLAAKVVKSVRGVEEITNDVTVDYLTERSDTEIRENVKKALKWDYRVHDYLINVSVNNDRVTLTGSVGSAYEKALAKDIAHTLGVKSVDASKLKVKPWASDEMTRKEQNLELTEVQKEDAIIDALERDPRVSAFDIEVEVEGGTVTLTGTVDNLKAKRAAANDAANTMGIWEVNKNLGVENKIVVTPVTDAGNIRQNIYDAIVRDPYVEASDINIKVDGGSVTLTGTAESYFDKSHTGDIVSKVKGVKSVENNLDVSYDAFAFEVESYDWNPVTADVDFVSVEKSDSELKEDVRDQMVWSPFLEAEDVTVTVNNGVVTLDGKVDNWREYNTATEEAYEAGALKVNNKLSYEINS